MTGEQYMDADVNSSSIVDPVIPTAASGECRRTLSRDHRRWRGKSCRRAERRVEAVKLLRDSSVQSSTRLYGSGRFGDGCVRPRTASAWGVRNANDGVETRLNKLRGLS